MVEIEARIPTAHEPALDELVPALLAVGLRMRLRQDWHLLALADVPDAHRALVLLLVALGSVAVAVAIAIAVLVPLRPIHIAHDRRLREQRSEERSVVCCRLALRASPAIGI